MKKRPLTILLGLLLTIAVAAGVIMYLTLPDRNKEQNVAGAPEYSTDTCYYLLQATNNETFDFAWMKFKILNGVISGTFDHANGESSLVDGTFTGPIQNYSALENEHTVATVWNSKPLTIAFGKAVAKASGVTMNSVSCDELTDIIKNRGPKY